MYRALILVVILSVALAACGDDDSNGNTNNNNENVNSGICGDGNLDPGEQCDEGSANSDSDPDACRTDCREAICGDSVTDTGETCDNGEDNSDSLPDACRTSCLVAGCGDGVIDTGEVCDDSNVADGDGCSADCVSDESCGNGIVDAITGEVCDCGLDSANLPQGCSGTNDALDGFCTSSCENLCVWDKYFESTTDGNTFAVAVAPSGNVAITGRFRETIDLGGGSMGNGTNDNKAFVALYGPDGTHLWSIPLACTGNSEGHGVAFDSQGNVIAMGAFQGTMTVDNTHNMTCYSGTGTYVVRLAAATGAVLGYTQLGYYSVYGTAPWGDRIGFGLAVDPSDNAVVVGSWNGCWGSAMSPCTTSQGNDIFIVKLTPTLAVDWSIRRIVSADDVANAVAVDASGNIYVQGNFQELLDFGSGWVLNAGTAGENFSFVAKLTAAGQVEWAKALGTTNVPGAHIGSGITALSSGDVVAVGTYLGTLTLSPTVSESSTDFRAYIASYDQDGNYLWHQSAGTDWAWAVGVTHDSNDNIGVTGAFSGTIDFGGGEHSVQTVRSAFLARYDAQGTYLGARAYGVVSENTGICVAAGPTGRLAMGGYSIGNVDFGCGLQTYSGPDFTPWLTVQNPP